MEDPEEAQEEMEEEDIHEPTLGERVPCPEVSASWDPIEKWTEKARWTWGKEEHNNVLEARAVLGVLRHLSRSSTAWNSRVLVFTDSRVTLGCLSKGRSGARALLRVCRQAAGIQLACRIRLYLRWVPSATPFAQATRRSQSKQ